MSPKIKTALSLLFLFISFLVYVSQYVNDFYVPDSDFFDYREKAIAIRNFENPGVSKRPPLYSTLIALISNAFQGRDSELYAAEAINMIAAAMSFFFLYRIARYFIGRWSFLFLWAWALHPSTIRMIIKPKAEVLLLALSCWAFWLFIRQKKVSYVIGFLSTTVRYEGACCISGIGGGEFFTQKNKLKPVLYSFLSLSFLLIWTFLSPGGTQGGSYVDFYSQGSLTLAYLGVLFKGTFEFLPNAVYVLPATASVMLMVYGIFNYIQKKPRETLYLVFYYLVFILMHIIWFTKNKDYLIIITWDSLLLITLGGYSLMTLPKLKEKMIVLLQKKLLIVPAVIVIIAELGVVWYQESVFRFSWMAFTLFNLAIVVFFLLQIRQRNLLIILIFLMFSLPVSLGMIRNHSGQFHGIHYAKAEYRLAAEWFARQPEGSRLVISQPFIAQYYSQRDSEHFMNLTELPNTAPDSLSQWLDQRGITHVAWLYDNRVYESEYSWYQWKLETRGWKSISFLETPKDHPGFEFIKQLKAGYRYALIYRVTS